MFICIKSYISEDFNLHIINFDEGHSMGNWEKSIT